MGWHWLNRNGKVLPWVCLKEHERESDIAHMVRGILLFFKELQGYTIRSRPVGNLDHDT
jgi:hypothetical protein